MNQLQALAMNEGKRWKHRLWSAEGRALLEKFPLAPWASRRRQDLLELLDRLTPTIDELTAAVEQEAKKWPEAVRLMTHPGVGPLTALAFVLIIGTPGRFRRGKQIGSYNRTAYLKSALQQGVVWVRSNRRHVGPSHSNEPFEQINPF
jgi:transposase